MNYFISVIYCILYIFSLNTIGIFGLSYSSNKDKLSSENPEQFKTVSNIMDDLITIC